MKEFILELGKDFLFVESEFAVQVGGSTRRIDLLFYHRALQCLVAIELKTVDFEPEFIGKMDMYLEALDRDVKRDNENPSIGIILCPSPAALSRASSSDSGMPMGLSLSAGPSRMNWASGRADFIRRLASMNSLTPLFLSILDMSMNTGWAGLEAAYR